MMHGWNGRGYYEVQVKLLLGAFADTVGSIAVLAHSVAGILSPDGVRTQHAVRAGRIEGLMLCVALPAGAMAAHYVVQPNRYYLATVSGCTATIFTSWPAIVLLFIWPPTSALFAAYYGCTSLSLHPTCRTPPVLTMDEGVMLWRLARYRKRVRGLVGSNVLQMSVARFARLAVFALVLVLLYVPAAFFTLSVGPNRQFYPYNWAAMHDADAWRHQRRRRRRPVRPFRRRPLPRHRHRPARLRCLWRRPRSPGPLLQLDSHPRRPGPSAGRPAGQFVRQQWRG